ncbi:acyl-CoA dehydrogenase [Streptomyces triticagri]|uniref:Acyl-CoA dehydrogenase n=1 Tax=Streptomyces triticagri TaxID=2293568 RepID=A0A372LYE1_9ACTN|nr:acyl-CoA dehydrogenase family protein [Streptomyces triticagri]RFU83672.1 acyl-CoA dehydrogenase [Streptomyces triticagri]
MGSYLTSRLHHQLREAIRGFAEREVRPQVPAMEGSLGAQHELSRLIAREGWFGPTIEAEYGGAGSGQLAGTIVVEELSRVSGALGAMTRSVQLAAAAIGRFGSDEQRKTWLPAIAAGECLPTVPGSGPRYESASVGRASAGPPLRAVRDGAHYLLNGRMQLGNCHSGALHCVLARTGPDSRDLTALLVEPGLPGLLRGSERRTLGPHGFSVGEIVFEDCRVPESARLGDEGDGPAVAQSLRDGTGRAGLTAVALGIHQALLDETTRLCAERRRHGKALHELPDIAVKLGRMQSRLTTARLAAYHAVQVSDRGDTHDAGTTDAGLTQIASALDSARTAREIQAAAGFTDRALERCLRDARRILAPACTADVQQLPPAAAPTRRADTADRPARTAAQLRAELQPAL